jgi:hypothetical protein
VALPPVICALPENGTSFASVLPAHARARRVANLIDPGLPLSTAVPLKTTHVRLTKAPLAEPVSVPGPMMLPRPINVALPEALVPLTSPEPWPV